MSAIHAATRDGVKFLFELEPGDEIVRMDREIIIASKTRGLLRWSWTGERLEEIEIAKHHKH